MVRILGTDLGLEFEEGLHTFSGLVCNTVALKAGNALIKTNLTKSTFWADGFNVLWESQKKYINLVQEERA